MSDHCIEKAVEYRDIPGFPGYRAGDDGSIWSNKKDRWGKIGPWKRLKPHLGKRGYYTVTLCLGGRAFQYIDYVHAYVLLAFVGPRPEGMEGCHDPDPNPLNNRLENLRWDTPASNRADTMRHGRTTRGSRNRHARLSADDVMRIRVMFQNGSLLKEVANEFNISESHACGIKKRRFWGWLPE